MKKLQNISIGTASAVISVFGFGATTGAAADSVLARANGQLTRPAAQNVSHRGHSEHPDPAGRPLQPGYSRGIWAYYDGPVYNFMGQVTGAYRGPVLGYSSSCNILTPGGYLYICENFTW